MTTTIFNTQSGEVKILQRRPAQAASDMGSAAVHEGERVIGDRAGELLHKNSNPAAHHSHEQSSRRADQASTNANKALSRANRRAQRSAQKEHQRIVDKNHLTAALQRSTDQERQEQIAIRDAGRNQLDTTNRLKGAVTGSSNGRASLLHGSTVDNPLLDPATRELVELDLTLLNQPGMMVERAGRSEDLKPGEALALATQVGVAPVLAAEAELVQVTAQLSVPEIDDDQRRALEEQLELIHFGINQSAEFAMVQGPAISHAMAREIESMIVDELRIGSFPYARENSSATARMRSFEVLFKPTEVGSSFAFAA